MPNLILIELYGRLVLILYRAYVYNNINNFHNRGLSDDT